MKIKKYFPIILGTLCAGVILLIAGVVFSVIVHGETIPNGATNVAELARIKAIKVWAGYATVGVGTLMTLISAIFAVVMMAFELKTVDKEN